MTVTLSFLFPNRPPKIERQLRVLQRGYQDPSFPLSSMTAPEPNSFHESTMPWSQLKSLRTLNRVGLCQLRAFFD